MGLNKEKMKKTRKTRTNFLTFIIRFGAQKSSEEKIGKKKKENKRKGGENKGGGSRRAGKKLFTINGRRGDQKLR